MKSEGTADAQRGLIQFTKRRYKERRDIIAPKNKEKSQKRNNIVSVKLTQAEMEYLTKLADNAKLSKSELIRNMLLDKTIKVTYEVVVESSEIQELIGAYGKIGSNLNQIAKYYNSGGERSLAMEDEIRQCISSLFELRKKVLKVLGGYYGNH